MSFKAGDLVWVALYGKGARFLGVAAAEHAAVVVRLWELPRYYVVAGPTLPRDVGGLPWGVHERLLRPRRDDYQQREPRVTRADLDRALRRREPVGA